MEIDELKKIEGLSKVLKKELKPDSVNISEYSDEFIVMLHFKRLNKNKKT